MFFFAFLAVFPILQRAETKEFLCRTQSTHSNVECIIKFSYSEAYAIPLCKKLDNNDMVVTIAIDKNEESISDMNFSCTSTSYLGISKIRFKNRVAKEEFTDIRLRHKGHINSHNFSEVIYVLDVVLPANPNFIFYTGEFVEYTIFGSHDYDDTFKVILEFYKAPTADIGAYGLCRLHNLQGEYPINLYHGSDVIIPVVTFIDDLRHTINGLLYNGVHFEIDGINISFNPTEGIRVRSNFFRFAENDTLKLVHDKYFQCALPTFKFYGNRMHENYPKRDLNLYGSSFNNILHKAIRQKTENSVTVSCSSKEMEVFIEPLIYPDVKIVAENYTLGTPPNRRFYATADIYYMTKEELPNATGWDDSMDLSNSILYTCRNSANSNLAFWSAHYDSQQSSFYYSSEKKAFVCDGIEWWIWGAVSMNIPVVRHWSCDNIFECQTAADYCLDDVEYENEWQHLPCNEKDPNCFHKKTQTKFCMRGIQTSSVPCRVLEPSDQYTNLNCEAVTPSKKGIVQCHTVSNISGNHIEFRRIYFEGFDGIIYVETEQEPPLEAKLKITSVYTRTPYFYTKAEFQFKCEGHSFFYSGLQWFFKYSNGSVLPPPPGSAEYSTVEPKDREHSNPEISASFSFTNKNVTHIVCSASLLNSKKWEHTFYNVSIFQSSAPEVVVVEPPVFFLSRNIEEQILTCQARGMPPPNITWKRFDQEIEEPLKALPGGMLVFPYYDDTFLGEYTCTATNFAESSPQVFTVRKIEDGNSESKNIYVYYLIGAVSALVCIVAVLTYRYLNSNKRQRYKEMKDVISLLEGVIEKGNGGSENIDPVNLPFNKKYEIQKDTFLIDRNVLLGKGEFSEVYKGHINGRDIPVAFKSPKHGSPIEYLKSLASELKILMYIGEHENLILLLGAYKREIEKGILYVAVELCGLGSLETFLRANKPKFIIRFQNSQNNEDINETLEDHFISFGNLLTWSAQIARGMAYLTSKRVIHSDLAARNVLLTTEGTAKVTDFGLSRQVYSYSSEYVKTGSEPLPWKWLAPECLLSHTFSSKSDVWAYGITLFEIFSLGDLPYPGTSFSIDFIERLTNGMRAAKPKYCNDEIYELMCSCWRYEPNNRPSFESLIYSVETINCGEQDIIDQQLDLDSSREYMELF